MSFFDGAQRGMVYGRQFTQLEANIARLAAKIKVFERDELDSLALRLGPQVTALARRLKHDYENLDEVLGDTDNVNQETEFEASTCRLTIVYTNMYKDLKRMHRERKNNSVSFVRQRKRAGH